MPFLAAAQATPLASPSNLSQRRPVALGSPRKHFAGLTTQASPHLPTPRQPRHPARRSAQARSLRPPSPHPPLLRARAPQPINNPRCLRSVLRSSSCVVLANSDTAAAEPHTACTQTRSHARSKYHCRSESVAVLVRLFNSRVGSVTRPASPSVSQVTTGTVVLVPYRTVHPLYWFR